MTAIRLRHLVTVGPRPTIAHLLSEDAEATFAPMDALADGLGGLDTSLTRPLSEVESGSYNFFANGDLLLAKVTPCFENGKKAFAKRLTNGIGFATSEVHVIRPDARRIDPRYLFYVLSAEDFRAAGMASMTGAGGLRRVSEAAVLNYRPRVTDLPTQKAIANFLDRETARIDQLIEKKQRLLEVLAEGLAALLEEATTPAEMIFEEMIPFRWVCRIAEGQVDPTDPRWTNQPLIAPNHIQSATGRLLQVETAEEQGAISGKYAYPAGTVLYSKIRPALAKACIASQAGMCSADMYPILPDKRRLLPEFLLMQLLSRKFTDWATLESMRVAMPKINRETLGNYRLWVPDKRVQSDLLARFQVAQAAREPVFDKVAASIERLREFRAALITAAVTGQIDVATWGKRGQPDRRLDAIQREMAS